jgi:hypothetical protein
MSNKIFEKWKYQIVRKNELKSRIERNTQEFQKHVYNTGR